ncbi:BLOC-1-related complex subunit 6 [Chanos chanos]|uniref:BLOC-1-related complex subunit 6 n=1 Tax=Chanos chanos TaxID=29144 RepID=A0A6J2W8U6_CHACN|nr:BLOC-1-related complex subunit 6 [Chanos chanos]
MSHSPVIGSGVQEETNGVDTSESPEACHWSTSHGSAPQVLKNGGGVLFSDREPHEGLPDISETHPSHNSVPNQNSEYRETEHTHSTLHPDRNTLNTHAPDEGALPTHTLHPENLKINEAMLQNTLRTDSSPKNRSHVDTQVSDTPKQKTAHSEPSSLPLQDGLNKESKEEKEKDVNEVEENQQRISEVPSELTGNPSSEGPVASAVSVSPTVSTTPPESAPPLVPAPPPASDPASVLPDPDESQCPAHVMAEVRVRGMPERERVVRGMQDSKSLDEISGACGGHQRGGARGGQAEGRRATISSALELEGTVSHDGDLTHFITKNLEQKIKMSSRPSLDCDSDCSGPVVRGRGSFLRRPADIPPIDPSVLLDLQKHTQDVAQSVEMMMRSLNGTIQNMTALSVGYIQTYRDSVDSLGESVDMSIKGMYTLMARCEELDRSMQPIHSLAAQIREIKRTLDALETLCK